MRNMRGRNLAIPALAMAIGVTAAAQERGGARQTPPGGRGGGGMGMRAYPQRQVDPAAVERGRGLYSVNCAFCHGSDARGGEGGPNLLRSTIVLSDSKGETMVPVVRDGRPAAGMPGFQLTPAQVADIAALLHSFPVGGRDVPRSAPATIVVGNAASGQKFFEQKCGSCHSPTRDLNGIANRINDPKTLQQTWIMPGGGGGRGAPGVDAPPLTVTVTLTSGQKVEGKLARVDDFIVSLRDSEGAFRSFPRSGSLPKVELHNPLQPHLDLLGVYTDKDIHDVTAYLVTLK